MLSIQVINRSVYLSHIKKLKNKYFITFQKQLISTSQLIRNKENDFAHDQQIFQEKFLTHELQRIIEDKWKPFVTSLLENNESLDKCNAKKKYILSMFPYPSGNLHMGHVRVYTVSDAISRFYYMKGYNVIHPMGWDAFGLPAENAAIERGENPATWTTNNIERMKEQLKRLGCAFDWRREIATCDPAYYRWTQYIFLKLYEHGLVYRQEAMVNWDPVDLTVLANEQVGENGCSWRSGAKVEKKPLTQWYIKATSLSKDLYEDLSDPCLQNWKDVPAIQRHWIGECKGYIIEMKVENNIGVEIDYISHLPLWMAHPEYLDQIAFVAVKSDNVLNNESYRRSWKGNSIVLNINVVNPLSKRRIPLIVNDSLKYPKGGEIYAGVPSQQKADELLCKDLGFEIHSDSAKSFETAKRHEVVTKLKKLNCGGYKSSSKLRDWLISRQRYWGTPIPVIYCNKCGTVPVPEEQLPIALPSIQGQTVKGTSSLKENHKWNHCPCPRCGGGAVRETDTMDTFVDSSWYYLRFLDPRNEQKLVDENVARYYMPVDLYIGGKEHAALHLYFARFVHKFLRNIGLVADREPFNELLMLGVVKSKSYQVKETGRYLTPDEVDFTASPPVAAKTRQPLLIQEEKMSKSKHNGVDPQPLVDEFGADVVRLTILAEVGPQSHRSWNSEDLSRSFQIMDRLWFLTRAFVLTRQGVNTEKMNPCSEEKQKEQEEFLFESRNQLMLQATDSLENGMQFHSAIKCVQQLMKAMLSVFKNLIYCDEYEKCLRCTVLLLSLMTPHLTAELWQRINQVTRIDRYKKNPTLSQEPWPSVDPEYKMEVVYKVNDENADILRLSQCEFSTLTKEKALQMAQEHPPLRTLLSDRHILYTHFKYTPNYKAQLSIFTKTVKEIGKSRKEKKLSHT